ncbi:hypothetical protein [Streptomyces sp. NPDC029526]|uniref:hypothetical protein n=1 Tax=Streptomyces sp. NPDC029526 TaxID=3155728 RepID=UPI0033D68899
MARPKPALERCVLCRLPVSRKKLVLTAGGQPLHRSCQAARAPSAPRSATPATVLTRAPKDISRAELLKRIDALRKRDAKKKAGAAKVRSAVRPKPSTAPQRGKRPDIPPQPYYGVEMKFIDGRWVQMHPDSE